MSRRGREDRSRPDSFARRARKEGFAARSVFKLEHVDKKEHIIRPGMKVLDLGAAPGSWMRYASAKVGVKGLVVGVDKKALERGLSENERFIQADVFELEPDAVLGEAGSFDVVLSDMMPSTIGHKGSDHLRSMAVAEEALHLALLMLKPGGDFLVKVFQGAEFESFRGMLRGSFNKVKIIKPAGSRKSSREIYLLGLSRKQADDSSRQ